MVENYIIDSSLFSSFQKGKALICALNGSRDIKSSPTLTEPNLYIEVGSEDSKQKILHVVRLGSVRVGENLISRDPFKAQIRALPF